MLIYDLWPLRIKMHGFKGSQAVSRINILINQLTAISLEVQAFLEVQ